VSAVLDPGTLRYDEHGLVPCICQDAATGDVLMLAWADREAVELSLSTGRATFWSRSRQARWVKGATSGHVLDVVEIAADCDGDTLLVRCHPHGPACHTGEATCFGPRRSLPGRLADDIEARRGADPRDSYVTRMLGAPREHVARKVGEEAVETLLAPPASEALVAETADLLFHAMLLLARDGVDPVAAYQALEHRRPSAPDDGEGTVVQHPVRGEAAPAVGGGDAVEPREATSRLLDDHLGGREVPEPRPDLGGHVGHALSDQHVAPEVAERSDVPGGLGQGQEGVEPAP
jgi:phosphoribosyl-AMP cyclohydrolase / phosphoribosyl-ATP pyrophosphohydrolase